MTARSILRSLAALVLGMVALGASASAQSGFHLQEATIADVHRAIRAKELTATQLVGHYLKRIEAYNGRCVTGAVDASTGYQLGDITPITNAKNVNALITLNLRGRRSKTDSADNNPNMQDALEQARALDEEFARNGQLKGPLHGVPFAVKDQFDTFDMRTTSGAAANYANDRPPMDAEIVARLRAAGAIILAKSNLGEYASGDRSTHGGTTCNPYDTARSAGRSSGGSGAAVAANLVMCAIGEETGPSARNPAANGSLVGIVATHSLVSRAGIIPASLTRDRPGALCRSVKDSATVLGVLAGYDPRDPTTADSMGRMAPQPYQSYADNADLRGLRIGVVREFMQVFTKADEDSVRIAEEALKDLQKAGATLIDPGPDGALFKDAIAQILPTLDAAASATNIRLLAEREPRVTGEVLFVMNRYLRERGDANIATVEDLIAKSIFFTHAPIDGVTLVPRTRLEDMLSTRQTLVKTSDGSVVQHRVPVGTLDVAGWHALRTTLQMLVNKVMADQRLDALVYPTKTIPAPLLANPVEPSNLKTVKESTKFTVDGVEYQRSVERATDLRAPLTPRLSPNAGLPTIAVPAGFTREVYDRAIAPGPSGAKQAGVLLPAKQIALPVSIDFLGRAYSEPVLIRIAAAYEAATRHRRPPKDFPPLQGEP